MHNIFRDLPQYIRKYIHKQSLISSSGVKPINTVEMITDDSGARFIVLNEAVYLEYMGTESDIILCGIEYRDELIQKDEAYEIASQYCTHYLKGYSTHTETRFGDKVALVGYSGSGKDYLSEVFTNRGYRSIALAQKVKEITMDIFPDVDKYAEGAVKDTPISKYGGCTPRDIWVKVSKGILEVQPLYFVLELIQKIRNNPDEKYIVTDVRTKDEYENLKKEGFEFILVLNPEVLPKNEFDERILEFSTKIHNVFMNDTKGLHKFVNFCCPNQTPSELF